MTPRGSRLAARGPIARARGFYDEDYGAGVKDVVPYRYAGTSSGAETAFATYTPNIPQEGFYPIYTWVLAGTDRTSQLYKINHTGGQTQIRVNHSMVGGGWVYLGTYHFDGGSSPTAGSVQISNEGAAGKVVIADSIRFGNGMGDMRDGPSGLGTGAISGYPREDEASLMWVTRAVGQGVTASSAVGTSNISAPSRMAEWMNVDSNPFGTSVYIGFHSNALADHTGRGAVGLITSGGTPNQAQLALYTGRQINQDMQALNGQFEHNWSGRTTHVLTSQFGEIDEGLSAEMDMTIIEVGFHDNVQDAPLLRDPKVRDQIGRSTYEATLEYFDNFGGLATPVTLPSAPTNVRAISNDAGAVTISWAAGPTGVYGNAATGFRIYASTDGYGFDGGTFVAGGATSTATLTGYDPAFPYFFKVVAVNAGGESKASEVMTALPGGGPGQVLIVSGFDRFDRSGNVRYPYAFTADGLVDRVWPRSNNSFDYVIQVAEAIHASAAGVHIASASNEAIISGAVNLADYDAVVWILGEESTANDTFNATEQTKVEQFLAGGGHLFTSGAEIGWDLDQQNNGRTFFETSLKGNYSADDAGTYNVTAAAGGIFTGLTFSFDNGAQFYNAEFPDVIAPQAGAVQALTYSGDVGGSAGIQVPGADGRGSVVMFGFPFETITTAANRAAVMDRVLDFFGVAPIVPTGDFTGDGAVDGADFLAWQRGFGAAEPTLADGDANFDGTVDAADLAAWQTQFGAVPSSPSASASAYSMTAELLAAEESARPTSQMAQGDLNAIAGFAATQRISFEGQRSERDDGQIRRDIQQSSRTKRDQFWASFTATAWSGANRQSLTIPARAETLPMIAAETAFAELGAIIPASLQSTGTASARRP
jgi:hypothetical protein